MYFDLLREMNKVRNDMNRIVNNRGYYNAYPAVNVYDNEEDIKIEALIPGASKDSLDISIENNVLSIKGEIKDHKSEDDKVIREEREYGKFQKSMKIGIPIDVDNIDAEYKDGILGIKLKKSEEAKPKKILVK